MGNSKLSSSANSAAPAFRSTALLFTCSTVLARRANGWHGSRRASGQVLPVFRVPLLCEHCDSDRDNQPVCHCSRAVSLRAHSPHGVSRTIRPPVKTDHHQETKKNSTHRLRRFHRCRIRGICAIRGCLAAFFASWRLGVSLSSSAGCSLLPAQCTTKVAKLTKTEEITTKTPGHKALNRSSSCLRALVVTPLPPPADFCIFLSCSSAHLLSPEGRGCARVLSGLTCKCGDVFMVAPGRWRSLPTAIGNVITVRRRICAILYSGCDAQHRLTHPPVLCRLRYAAGRKRNGPAENGTRRLAPTGRKSVARRRKPLETERQQTTSPNGKRRRRKGDESNYGAPLLVTV